jgi:hypothetical protein
MSGRPKRRRFPRNEFAVAVIFLAVMLVGAFVFIVVARGGGKASSVLRVILDAIFPIVIGVAIIAVLRGRRRAMHWPDDRDDDD